MEDWCRSLEGKRIEGSKDNNVDHMWKQVKWTMAESAREVCGSVRWRGEGKNPKSMWWIDEVKAVVRRKEVLAAWDFREGRGCVGHIFILK